jgi:biotin operon repressor
MKVIDRSGSRLRAIQQWHSLRVQKYPKLESREWLMEQYHQLEMSQEEIALLVGCSRQMIRTALKRLKIPLRSRARRYALMAEKISGIGHYNWKGGICNGVPVGREAGGYQRMLMRKLLLSIYGNVCQKCGKALQEPLETHHIVPPRFGGDNTMSNVVLLCTKCHGEENSLFLAMAAKKFVLDGCQEYLSHVSIWKYKKPTTIS